MNPAKRAAQILAQYGGDALPVPVEAIAQALGYRVARAKHDGNQCSFVARSSRRESAIGINTSRGVRSQRFAAAHALGHAELGDERQLIVCRELNPDLAALSEAQWAREEEATRFAVELVMPRQRVLEHAGECLPGHRGGRGEFVTQLAARFGVTVEAMAFRLVDLAVLVP